MTDLFTFVWLAIGGGLRFFDFGRWTIPLAAWLAPVLLIHFAHLNDPLLAIALIWFITMIAGYFALRGVIPLPKFIYPIFIGLLAVLIENLIGILVGALAGYYGGVVDSILMPITEAMLNIPEIFLLLHRADLVRAELTAPAAPGAVLARSAAPPGPRGRRPASP